MALVTHYNPLGIRLPDDLVAKYQGSSFLKRQSWDHAEFDIDDSVYPYMHAVFRTRDDRHLVLINSGWRERSDMHGKNISALTDELGEMQIFCDGKELQYETELCAYPYTGTTDPLLYASYVMYRVALTDIDRSADLQVTVRYGKSYVEQLSVPPNLAADWQTADFLLTAVQKDNRPEAVRDWVQYYHRAHGVGRFAIYDNNSTNKAELLSCLRQIADEVEIIVIDWHYPYAAAISMTQRVALNHVHLLFGDSARYYLNYDIDEYLVNESKLPLSEKLASLPDLPYLATHEHKCMDYNDAAHRSAPGVYNCRRLLGPPIMRGTKTINAYGRFQVMDVHNTWVAPATAQPAAEAAPAEPEAQLPAENKSINIVAAVKSQLQPRRYITAARSWVTTAIRFSGRVLRIERLTVEVFIYRLSGVIFKRDDTLYYVHCHAITPAWKRRDDYPVFEPYFRKMPERTRAMFLRTLDADAPPRDD